MYVETLVLFLVDRQQMGHAKIWCKFQEMQEDRTEFVVHEHSIFSDRVRLHVLSLCAKTNILL